MNRGYLGLGLLLWDIFLDMDKECSKNSEAADLPWVVTVCQAQHFPQMISFNPHNNAV